LFSWSRKHTSGFVSDSGIKATMYGNEAVSCVCAFEWFEDSKRDIRNLEINLEWAVVSCSKSVTAAKVED
jgi:virulence-associated protein VapD